MTRLEYARILEEYAKRSPSEEARAAYKLSLEMYMMVKDGSEYGKKTGDGESEGKGAGKAVPVEKAAGGEIKPGEKKTRKAPEYKPKECRKCGETFTPHYGAQTMCVECAATIARIAEIKPKQNLKISDPEYRRKMAEDLAGGKG